MRSSPPELSPEDRALLEEAGLSPGEVGRQVELLRSPPPPIRLDRPCTVDDGITRLRPEDDGRLLQRWEAAAAGGRLSKFVPASGAASRMFDSAARVLRSEAASRAELTERATAGDRDAAAILELLERFPELPFAESLAACLDRDAEEIEHLSTGDETVALLTAMLESDGLGYSSLAKGLIPFHRYETGARTSFEEHLIEGTRYLADSEGRTRFHFTVPPPQQARFERAAAELAARHGLDLEVTFSVQSHTTDTVAIDPTGALFRRADGRLLFRPGGHGALIGNLERTGADVVFIKNIDNIVPSTRHDDVARWMQRLAGLLLEAEGRSHELQERLSAQPSPADVAEAEAFCRERLFWAPTAASPDRRTAQLLDRLDRPLRVCGMVRNEGEPGGGPFWVRDASGRISPQIIESAQIAANDPSQSAIWSRSTHFNPVLLVASLRDRRGEPYRLAEYVDRQAVFVSDKAIGGETARVLEHPGLWNGAMANWNTIFAEVPIVTFAPVKTVLDLLRPAHRADPD